MDEAIVQFTSITGADPSKAAAYLRLTDGNAEHAITLYFEDPNLANDAVPTPSAAATSSHAPPPRVPAASTRPRTYREDADGVVYVPDGSDEEELDIDMDEDEDQPAESSIPACRPNVEDDEAVARRLQEEMYGEASRDPDAVRAPIARTSETLVGPGSAPWEPDDDASMQSMIAHQMAARQARRQQAGRPGIFNQRDTQSAVWEDADANPSTRNARAIGGSGSSNKAASLAEMFRPPFEIICRLPWDQAREEGKEDRKWLLVNVQDAAVFDCQVLNRDLWKDERVVAIIQHSFLFLQYSKDDPRGNNYMQYYFSTSREVQDAYPHIAIVDPRTGEQVKVWSGRPTPKVGDFLEDLTNFLDRYSLDNTAKNPVAKRKPEQPKEMNIDRMTEDEMLEMALQNSLANGSAGALKPEDPDDLTKSMTFEGKGKGIVTRDSSTAEGSGANGSVPAPVTPFSLISSDKSHEEPANDPASTTRIQFRHSGGRPVVRRFALADPVRRIYEWLKAAPFEGKEGVEFDLSFMGKNLIESLASSIQDAGLKSASVNVEYLSQEDDEEE
ncbi:hypothetical protein EJ08DRAFT_476337 [Tothia fuscella]|uniref:UBX domain-containing protein n=1 Tax=Tothia fuscella TaxID=1048955 RepID=A0A9P4NID3_9PEZI|nr:hypothetical protein EJ08DRAFT_476337 [Tothia fuscella]